MPSAMLRVVFQSVWMNSQLADMACSPLKKRKSNCYPITETAEKKTNETV